MAGCWWGSGSLVKTKSEHCPEDGGEGGGEDGGNAWDSWGSITRLHRAARALLSLVRPLNAAKRGGKMQRRRHHGKLQESPTATLALCVAHFSDFDLPLAPEAADGHGVQRDFFRRLLEFSVIFKSIFKIKLVSSPWCFILLWFLC